MAYVNASHRTVLVMEFAHKWAIIQNMNEADAANSSELYSFNLFAREFPRLAELAKAIQFDAFDRVNAL